MQTIHDKATRLLAQVNWERAELAGLRNTERPAEALVAHLERQPRPAYHFELTRKADILAFLAQYASWRAFSTKEADRLVAALPKDPNTTVGLGELGPAWWATGNPQYGATFDRVFLDNETGRVMPNYCFRSLAAQSDLHAYLLLQDCPALTMEGRIAFFDHLLHMDNGAFDQVLMGYKHRVIGPNGHNFWPHSSISLPETGLLFPEFARSAFFLRAGDSVLEEHMRNNYKSDGGSRETAFGYQIHMMIQLWTTLMLHGKNGVPFSPQFRERLFAGTHFILRLMTPQGGFPKFGDMEHAPGGLTQMAAVATAATADGEFKWYAEYCRRFLPGTEGERPGQLPYGAFWRCGLAGARVYEETRPQTPVLGSVLMSPTGIAALRDGVVPTSSYLAIIAAERGPIVTSHGHSDVFSLDVSAGGERFIGEPKCKMYGYSEGRQYELHTASKSTVTVNGATQVPMPKPFRFDGHVNPAVCRWISAPTHDFFHGVHEAYFRHQSEAALHERKVFFLKAAASQPAPGYWVVFDCLEAAQENDYAISFKGLHPGKLDGTTALLRAPSGMGLAIVPPTGDPLTVEIEISPERRAFLQEYEFDAEQHPCFVYRQRAADACFVWVLAPLAPARSAPTVRRIPVRINGSDAPLLAATAVEINFGAYRDLLCIAHKDFDNQLDFAGESVWGNLAFRRIAADGGRLLVMEHTVRDGTCGR